MEILKHLLLSKCGVYFLEANVENHESNSYKATLQTFKLLEVIDFGKLETEYVVMTVLYRFIRDTDDILKASPFLIGRQFYIFTD